MLIEPDSMDINFIFNLKNDDILIKYYFRKVEGVIPIAEPFQKVYEDRKELSVDFYINKLMNAVFQFIDGKGKVGVVMSLEEHNSFIERESVILPDY